MLTDEVGLERSNVPLQTVIDALSAHVAVCDGSGLITAVNSAWRQFADDNDGRLADDGLGLNYLGLLEGAIAWAEATNAPSAEQESLRAVVAGFRDVASGRLRRFQTEYRCDAPGIQRWFLLTIGRITDDAAVRIIATHENISGVKAAEVEQLAHSAELIGAFSSVIESIARLIEQRDPYTAGHQRGTVRWCALIADEIGFEADRRQGLLLGAGIHDIGKIAVPAEILVRPGRLTPLEMEMIRCHPTVGYEVLRGVAFPWPIAEMVHQHHESYDGSGYPNGLAGEEICIEARIIAIADMFDAMTSHRPYRPARELEEAIAELQRFRGVRFDPAIVDAMLRVLRREPTAA